MKKLKILLLGVICGLILPSVVEAASAKINITGASSVVVGNKVTVSVTLSSGTAIGSWEMDLNYDKNCLQLVSSSAEAGGTYMVNATTSVSGTKSKTYTFTFKALKSGNARVSISSYSVYDNSMNLMNISTSAKTIRIMTQQELEATYSKDNNLKSLSVDGYKLDKDFDKDTLEYKVDVPTGTTSVKINAVKNDNRSNVTGAGEVEVTEGLNTIPIVVTAQNGSEKTYTLIVNVEDLNPITVSINNENYTVVKNVTLLTAPITFEETTININNYDIPAFVNNAADIVLVGLKDNEGKIKLFQYKEGNYSNYNELSLKDLMLIPVAFDKELDYTKTTVNIHDEELEAYKYSAKSPFVIINAKDLTNGKVGLYLYDAEDNQAMRFDEEFINSTKDTIKNYSYIIIILAGASLLMLILILCLVYRLRKNGKKIDKFVQKQEAKIEATRKLNDVVEEVKKITEAEKSKNNKKKKQEVNDKPKEEITIKEIKPAKKDEKEEVKELTPKAPIEDSEEMYNLFEEDKKKKKK